MRYPRSPFLNSNIRACVRWPCLPQQKTPHAGRRSALCVPGPSTTNRNRRSRARGMLQRRGMRFTGALSTSRSWSSASLLSLFLACQQCRQGTSSHFTTSSTLYQISANHLMQPPSAPSDCVATPAGCEMVRRRPAPALILACSDACPANTGIALLCF